MGQQSTSMLLSIGSALAFSMVAYTQFGLIPAILLFVLVEILIRYNRWVYILYRTLPRDVLALYRFAKLNVTLTLWEKNGYTVARIFTSIAKQYPNKVAFKFEERELTFAQVDAYSNQIACYFKSQGFQHGDIISVFMESKPEYVCLWLGLSKIGIVSALINTNLRNDPLLHSITIAKSKALVYGTELLASVAEIRGQLKDVRYFEYSGGPDTVQELAKGDGVAYINQAIRDASAEPLLEDMARGKPTDKLVYIFTSGTTGLPKAAVINNVRFMFMVMGVHYMLDIQRDDVVYDPLPLYHSAGGMVGVGQAILKGSTVALRKKFSASNFWSDCIKFECTVAQYIGEICRFLLSVPEKPEDKQHKIRMMFGNGLRPQIWQSFVDRFEIPDIGEFYGATEGNSNLVNIDSKVGAVGFVPRYARIFYPVAIIKCDEVTGEIIRDQYGNCIRCKVGEPGVFVGKINPRKAINSFTGYADKRESEKKIVQNVFKKNDLYFNSGDILVMDDLGYFFFKDRTGDTFRWRGENVATSEVESVISTVAGLNDAVVYGVEIPNVEGRAGMAAIVDTTNNLDLDDLLVGINNQLPVYARPMFIRVLNEVPMTGTFKLKKRELQVDGYDITKITDKIYFFSGKSYVLLTDELYANIVNGKVRI